MQPRSGDEMKQKPDLWALLIVAFALSLADGSGLTVITWWGGRC